MVQIHADPNESFQHIVQGSEY